MILARCLTQNWYIHDVSKRVTGNNPPLKGNGGSLVLELASRNTFSLLSLDEVGWGRVLVLP